MKRWARAEFQPNLPLEPGKYVTACAEHIALSKKAAAEGMVLIKNNGTLPLDRTCGVALFGKGSFDYVKGGGGSGDVTTAYVRSLCEGFRELGVPVYEPAADYYREYVSAQYAAGAQPGMLAEPELDEALVSGARRFTDTAIIVLSRFSGEGWDRSSIECNWENLPWMAGMTMPKICGEVFPDGDFYLTKEEKQMIARVTAQFDRVVAVLNIGGVIDTSWIKNDDSISSALVMWQGGMEGGLAAAEILTGIVNPSGRLPDTFAERIEDYPSTENFHEDFDYVDYTDDVYVGYRYFETIPGAAEKVCYPFGFGLSYTTFALTGLRAWEENGEVCACVTVANTGSAAGRETVQLYTGSPDGVIMKPAKELRAFAKTALLQPGESQEIVLQFDRNDMASYDDLGRIAKSAYVLEKGTYAVYVGTSVRDVVKADFSVVVNETQTVRQLSAKLVPTSLEKRLLADGTFETLPTSEPHDINECIFEKMIPGSEEAIAPEIRGESGKLLKGLAPVPEITLMQVAEGKASLDDMMALLSDDDLISLVGGQPNTGVANTFGFGNLPEFDVPNIMTADGPAGVRINEDCGVCTTAWPCATLLASTWDYDIVSQVGAAGGRELKENNLSVWLTPAVNIHRNPLCGRNFEYYSEDPFLTGRLGGAMVSGIQSQGVGATVKHFACNNKETNRKHSDSRLSERALREIYLKGFEMIVKEADPWVIMSSYNAINGHRASESRELLEDILRGEWGYKGVVCTDWWNRGEHYKEILAGNDIKMACGFPDRVRRAMEMGALTRADLEVCARRVLELILKID